MSLHREDLDASGCGTPGCKEDHNDLFFHARCHPTALVEARYVKSAGVIVIKCGACHRLIAEVAVASRAHCFAE